MESAGILIIVWALTCLSGPSTGYSNGRVEKACMDMTPHHGKGPQKSPEHTLVVNMTEFKPGDHVHVKLSGPVFKGFLLQARDAGDVEGPPAGSFALANESISQLLTCKHKKSRWKNSAVSHTSSYKKTYIDAFWIAPSDVPKKIQFFVTVVEEYKRFWVKIPGPIISQPKTPALTTTMPTVESIPTSLPLSPLSQPFNASGCGTTKFCVRNPSNCNPESDDCFFLAFKQDGDSVLVEMSGPSEGYIAFALSNDQWMGGGDDAYFCISEDHHVDINTASLIGRAYPEFDTEESDALEKQSWRLANGLMQCSFRRRISLPDLKGRLDLDANYYIFLADGEVGVDGTIYKHHRQPLVTNGKYNISGPAQDIGGSRSPLLIKIHGALMFVAWMTTVSIGVIVARFFKPVWPQSLFGEEIWFQVHRALMMTTVLLTSISFVLPFVYRGGWSQQAGFHAYLGCTVMALAIVQPLMAAVRPPPQAPRRHVFNCLHWCTGTTARILAVVTVFLGMDLPALNLPDPWDTYTMIGFVAWHVGIDILLEMHGYCLIRKVEVLEDDRIHILQSMNSLKAQGHTFKQTVLIIYICGNIAFLVTFLAAIGQI
ncbi:putative ferric-chelate reductase 1 [Hemicordylus capensis]|uniref:putative ferric-chelate reductase 1 n=1 Tax=Hemicordylus capensis TaxID=884348 RepID=UPI002302E47A|nr:putative ferric-chelate reductase 1 [Hemicordylus capensis]XP_053101817.1 putative ferric-chelate reductase 1 [Hemicordylus capensis]XP_053101818.1 putative ferric-chelate reductase 1 [Hemicordylus capensis]XP_053101819.1 putative ferric-chelate reductase 1 [Hemicordylus capensis]